MSEYLASVDQHHDVNVDSWSVGLTLFVGLLFSGPAYLFISLSQARRKYAHIPGPKPNGLKGNIDDIDVMDMGVALTKWVKEYGHAFVMWLGPMPWVFTANPDDLRAIWVSDFMKFDRGNGHDRVKPWLGIHSIVNVDNEDWVARRKIFNVAFQPDKLDKAIPVFVKKADVMCDMLRKAGDKKVDIIDILFRLSTDVTSMWAFDYDTQGLEATELTVVHDAITFAHKHFIERLLSAVPNWAWEWGLYCSADVKLFREKNTKIYDLIYRIIDQRKSQPIDPKATDLLSMLLVEDQAGLMSRKELAENMYTIFTASMNVPCVVEWAIVMLSENRDCETKLREELTKVFGNGPDASAGITPKKLDELKYMRMFIDETLRLNPPARSPATRKALEEYVLPGSKVRVPKGAEVAFCMYTMHQLPEHWPEPERFDPERFTPEAKEARSNFAFCPFELGRRNCLGQHFAYREVMAVFSHLLCNFDILEVDCSKKLERSVIARPQDLHVSFRARH